MNGNVDTHQWMSNAEEIYTINMINTINSPGGGVLHACLMGHCRTGNSERDNEKFWGIGDTLMATQQSNVLILTSYNETFRSKVVVSAVLCFVLLPIYIKSLIIGLRFVYRCRNNHAEVATLKKTFLNIEFTSGTVAQIVGLWLFSNGKRNKSHELSLSLGLSGNPVDLSSPSSFVYNEIQQMLIAL